MRGLLEQSSVGDAAEAERLTSGRGHDTDVSELQRLRTEVVELRRALAAAEHRANQAQAERNRTEQAIRVGERIYRAIGESINFGIWICAPDGRNTYASQSFLDLLGITQEQCSNFGWGDILHPDDSARTIAAWKECVRTQGTWDIEHRYRRADGEYQPMLARGIPVKNENGEIECWAGINLDISRLKAAESRLLRNQKRLELIAETASRLLGAEDPLAVVHDLCCKVMNHIDCQLFVNFIAEPSGRLHLNAHAGISAEAAREIEWLDYGVAVCGCVARDKSRIIAEDIQHVLDPRTTLVRSLGVQAYCCHPLMANQRMLGTLSFGSTKRTHFTADEIELMRAVADQVATAMQRLISIQELSRANAQLREVDRQKSHFLAVLSHELRNPLAPIVNGLYILDRAEPGGPKAQKAKQIIGRQVCQLTRMVDDLLDATRFARGQLRVEKTRIDLADLVARTADDYRSRFEDAQIHFEVVVKPMTPLWINADGTRIAQAVGNLLSNAVKFTPTGGHVTLVVGQDTANTAVIRVKDDGVGISEEILARLFEPFVQADNSLDRKQGGLGLGLSLVKGVVDLHGGSVQGFSDGSGKGAEFVVQLPIAFSSLAAPTGSGVT